LAKLVSVEAKRLPNTANIVLPRSFCQLNPCSICWWDCEGEDGVTPAWSQPKPGDLVWLRFGGNLFLLEHWGLHSVASACAKYIHVPGC